MRVCTLGSLPKVILCQPKETRLEAGCTATVPTLTTTPLAQTPLPSTLSQQLLPNKSKCYSISTLLLLFVIDIYSGHAQPHWGRPSGRSNIAQISNIIFISALITNCMRFSVVCPLRPFNCLCLFCFCRRSDFSGKHISHYREELIVKISFRLVTEHCSMGKRSIGIIHSFLQHLLNVLVIEKFKYESGTGRVYNQTY